MSAGKGSSPRSCFSAAYKANFDAIFRKPRGGKDKSKLLEPKPLEPSVRTIPPHP